MNLGSTLVETLLPMAAGVLCITCDERGEDFEPARDTRWSYARLDWRDGSRLDLMASLSIATLPNPALAADLRQTARGQQEVARAQEGPRARASYEEGARRYAWQAEHVMQFSREMPSLVAALDGQRVIAAFRNGSKDASFRVVAARQQQARRTARSRAGRALAEAAREAHGIRRSVRSR